MKREFILCAALNFNGNIICGHRHSDCYKILIRVVNVNTEDIPQSEHQGFLTSLNRFVDRKEGWKIAKENNQIILCGLDASQNEEDSQLKSENLY